MPLPNLLFNVNNLGHLEELKVFKHTVLDTKWPSFKTALDLRDRSKNIFTFLQNRSKNDICYLYFENFFSKKIFFLELSNS